MGNSLTPRIVNLVTQRQGQEGGGNNVQALDRTALRLMTA
jgi:hypothetical protein